MYELKESTCDCCGTVYRAVNRKHHCDHCSKYYYVCTKCNEKQSNCPDCGIPLKRRTEPLNLGRGMAGLERHSQRKARYFGNR